MRKRIDRLEQTLFGCQRKLEQARERRDRLHGQMVGSVKYRDHFEREITRYDMKITGLLHTIFGTLAALEKMR